MSRVGKKAIKIPAGTKVNINGEVLEVSGKEGTLRKQIPRGIKVELGNQEISLKRESDDFSSLHGLYRTLVSNMVTGVGQAYTRDLELQGVGYRAQVQGTKLTMSLGFSHPVEFHLPDGIKASVEANTKIQLKGADKELLGLTAAKLRKIKPPEPYKGKGIRFAGEKIVLKQGKTAGSGGK